MRIFLGAIVTLLLAAPAWAQTVPDYNKIPTCVASAAGRALCGAVDGNNSIVRFTNSLFDVIGIPVVAGGTNEVIAYCEDAVCWIIGNDSGGPPVQSVNSLASGTLTLNTVNIATATGADYNIPDGCDSATGNWVTVVVQDDSSTISVTVGAAEDTMIVPGLSLDADDELDSSGDAAGAGEHITFVCAETNLWYTTSIHGAWVDGGVAN